MTPQMNNSLKYNYTPYKGTIGSQPKRFSPYKGTIPYKNKNSGKLYKGTIKPKQYARKDRRPVIPRHQDKGLSHRGVNRPPKEVKSKKAATTVKRRPHALMRPKNTNSLYKGNIAWQAQQKPFKGYQYKPYKGTIGVVPGPYKEYRLPDDYYGFGKRRKKVYPLQPVPSKQYNPGFAKQQPTLEREVELKENRYVPTYATSKPMDRQIVDNTPRYKPEYASVKQEDKQIIYNESKYTPAYAGLVHTEKEIIRPSPYQPQTAHRIPEDRTVTESHARPSPAYIPILAAMHTNDKTVQGPRKTSPIDDRLRQSPVVNDPLREHPSRTEPTTTIVPVVAAVSHSNKQSSDMKPEHKSKHKPQASPSKNATLENSVDQQMRSPVYGGAVVVPQASRKNKDYTENKAPPQLRNLPPDAPKEKSRKGPVVASVAAAATANKRKPAEPKGRASALADPISLFPPLTPEPVLSGPQGNSQPRISPDAMRYEPSYKHKPEPMFPPLIPVSSVDYVHSKPSPQAKSSQKDNGNPLIPVMVPFNDGKNPYYNFSPQRLSDDFSSPSSPTYSKLDFSPRYTGIPSYSAVGSVLRSLQVYNY